MPQVEHQVPIPLMVANNRKHPFRSPQPGETVEKRIHYGATFAVLATAALAFSLLQSLIIPAIPQLEQTLHTSESGASWLLTAYLLSAAIATPI